MVCGSGSGSTKNDILRRAQTIMSRGTLGNKLKILEQLASIDDRRIFSLLLAYLNDENISPYIINTLAKVSDSRALFPLMNLYHQTTNPIVEQRILQYIAYTKDPRAAAFLCNDYLKQRQVNFRDILENAFEACVNNYKFLYRYEGNDTDLERARKMSGSIKVLPENLNSIEEYIKQQERDYPEVPLTYVIIPSGDMKIGVNLNEHVDVARGKDVKAAGEVRFTNEKRVWKVTYINNRSNGYHPTDTSFHWVAEYFKSLDIAFDKKGFDETFPKEGYNNSDFLALYPLFKS